MVLVNNHVVVVVTDGWFDQLIASQSMVALDIHDIAGLVRYAIREVLVSPLI